MSTPATNAATDSPDNSQNVVAEQTFQQQVNEATDNMTQGDDGKWSFPDGLDENVQFAANSERRRRDTQSALAKSNSALAISQEENVGLVKLVKQGKAVHLTPEQTEELQELKFSDPDEWRKRMNDLERVSNDELDTTLSTISTDAKAKGAVGEREILLSAFLDDNPGLFINDEVLQNEIPPRITKALESGEVSFMQFLGNVKDYLQAGKVIENTPGGNDPNLADLGGSDTPSDAAQAVDETTSYEDTIF